MENTLVEIIRRGTGAERVTCPSCDSELKYMRTEVETYTSTDYTGGKDTHKFIRCPVCSEEVHVK